MLLFLFFSYLFVSPLNILNEGRLQRSVENKEARSTIISVASFLMNFFGIFVAVVFGYVAKVYDLAMVYSFVGGFLFVFSVFYFFGEVRVRRLG